MALLFEVRVASCPERVYVGPRLAPIVRHINADREPAMQLNLAHMWRVLAGKTKYGRHKDATARRVVVERPVPQARDGGNGRRARVRSFDSDDFVSAG